MQQRISFVVVVNCMLSISTQFFSAQAPLEMSLDVADVSALVSLLNEPSSGLTSKCEVNREVRLWHHLRRMQRSAVEGS